VVSILVTRDRVRVRLTIFTVSFSVRGQFTCPKGHLSETYRHRVRVRIRVKFTVRVRVRVS